MVEALREFLAQQPIMLLFLAIGSGYLLSKVRIRGISLGMASVLFMGIGLGMWGKDTFHLPEIINQLGLLLFVYTVGLEAGPAFFRILKRRGFLLVILGLLAVFSAATIAQLLVKAFGIHPALAVGLFCGGLTNTPALAAATEVLQNKSEAALLTVGYSVAYPLAVLLPITLSELIGLGRRINIKQETYRAEQETGTDLRPPVETNLQITTSALTGVALHESPFLQIGAKVSRVQRGEQIAVPTPDMVLQTGDILNLVGTQDQIRQVIGLDGIEILQHPGPETKRDQVDYRRILLTNPRLFGRRLGEVGIESQWNAVVTRLRRGDVDFVPTDNTVLEHGDRLRVVARTDDIPSLTRYLGDSLRALGTTDYLTLSIGILLGLLLGNFTLQLPGNISLKLGLAGGPLVAALILGGKGKTGPFVWALPAEIGMTFREFGLVIFFASIGIRSGSHFLEAVLTNGLQLILFGALITTVSSLILLIGAMGVLKLDWVSATGILAGGQTQPAILSFIGNLAKSEAPNVSYASIMPTAMVGKIIMAQLLVWWLGT